VFGVDQCCFTAKFEEADGCGVSIIELREHLEYVYTKELFIEMEAAVLTALDWRLMTPTLWHFCSLLSDVGPVFDSDVTDTMTRPTDKDRRLVTKYISFFADTCLPGKIFLGEGEGGRRRRRRS